MPVQRFKKLVLEFFAKLTPGNAYWRYAIITLVTLGAIIIIFVILLALPYLTGGKYQNPVSKLTGYKPAGNQGTSLPEPTPTPIPPRPIPHGKIGFTVGQSDKTVPLFGRGFVDPYDPAKGSTQTVTIAVKYTKPVTKVTAVLKTDNNISQPYPFKLISGSDTEGEWQGSWQITDTYLYTYALVFNAESSNKSGSVEVTLR